MSYHELNKNKNWNPKCLEITNYTKNHKKNDKMNHDL